MNDAGLLKAYRRFHGDAALSMSLSRRASAPLLVQPSEEWFASSQRLLIVGQETNGWLSTDGTLCSLHQFYHRPDAVPTMLSAYADFQSAATYAHKNSAFWNAFRLLRTGHSALWTNLFRTDVDGSVMRNCGISEWKDPLHSQGALLREEIRELAPTVVVFLTGPHYDHALQQVFADAAILPLWPAVPSREVGLVQSQELPLRTIRSYHPSYLQRSRRWHLLSRLVEWLNEARLKVPGQADEV